MAPSVIRKISASDGTTESKPGFVGKLQRLSVSRTRSNQRNSEASTLTTKSPRNVVPHRRNHSGGSDRKHMEAEQAHERLAMEQAEYERNRESLQERRASIISQQQSTPGKKEWFDRGGNEDLFKDDDNRGDEKRGGPSNP